MAKQHLELKDIVKAAYGSAKRIIEEDKAEMLTPIFMALQPGKTLDIIATPLDDDRQKEALAAMLRQKFREDGTKAYVHVSEAWMLKADLKEGMPKIAPSQSERRQEVVVFCGQDGDKHTAIFAVAEILRDENNVRSLAPLDTIGVDSGGVAGRFGTLLFQ